MAWFSREGLMTSDEPECVLKEGQYGVPGSEYRVARYASFGPFPFWASCFLVFRHF